MDVVTAMILLLNQLINSSILLVLFIPYCITPSHATCL